jgi:hypothetical protein
MSWTATLLYLGPTGEAAVEFRENQQAVTVRYQTTGTLASLRPQVVRTAAELARPKDLVEGASIDVTPDTPPPPPPVDPVAVARRAFSVLVGRLNRREAALRLQLATQADVDADRTAVRAAFQPGFEDLL